MVALGWWRLEVLLFWELKEVFWRLDMLEMEAAMLVADMLGV